MKRRGRPRHPDILTPREWEVLRLICEGLTNRQIADRLGITLPGARYHVSEILAKLGVQSREEARDWFLKEKRPWAGLALPMPFVWRGLGTGVLATILLATISLLLVVALRETPRSLENEAAIEPTAEAPEETPRLADLLGIAPDSLGKLAYVHEGDLWLKVLPEGPAQRLTSQGDVIRPELSPSGAWVLASWHRPDAMPPAAGQFVIGADGFGRRDVQHCRWMPTDDRLLCISDDGFLIQTPDRSTDMEIPLHVLTSDLGGSGFTLALPFPGPDGEWLAYAVHGPLPMAEFSTRYSGVWIVRSDGSGVRELFGNDGYSQGGGQIAIQGWSTDGTEVLYWLSPFFSASAASDGLRLYSVRLADAYARDVGITLPRAPFASLSPSGNVLALTDGAGRQMWTNKRLALVDLSEANFAYLTAPDVIGLWPAWSPDGSRIAYSRAADAGPDVWGGDDARRAGGLRRVWVVNADGTGHRQITNDPHYRDERPLWSDDGAFILFARLDLEDQASVWIVPAAGGAPQKLVDISRPLGPLDAPLWFGYYGYLSWDQFFDWLPVSRVH
jgi:DNA-binding CsgD family transcriptional regulator